MDMSARPLTARLAALQRPARGLGASLFASLIAASWLSLLTTGLGHFSPTVAWLGAALAGLGTFFIRRRRASSLTETFSPAFWLLLLLAIGMLVLNGQPGELLLGGWDPGVYVHTAASVARHGTLQFPETDLAALSAEECTLLARNLHGICEPFGGMRLLPNGTTSPQFYHLYPCLMALAWRLGGLTATLWVNPVLNIGAILALYALAAQLLGRRWGGAAALILAMNPAQIWQAKFSTAEMLTQLFLLGGMALLVSALEGSRRRRLDAVLGGAALGAALLTRYHTAIPLGLFGPALLLMQIANRPRVPTLLALAALGALALHAWAHQRWVAPYYAPLQRWVAVGLAAACFGAVCLSLAVGLYRISPPVARLLKRVRPWLRGVSAAAVASWFLFAWLLRPVIETGWDRLNMLYLRSLFGPLGLSLAVLGLVWLMLYVRKPVTLTWFLAALAVLGLLSFRLFHGGEGNLFMMWVSRRFVPAALPLLAVAVAAGARWISETLRRVHPRLAALGPLLLAAALLLSAPASAAMLRQRDWPGLCDWMDTVAARLPDDAPVYVDQPGFAAALRFLYGKRAFELHRSTPERRAILLEWMRARAAAGPVYFLSCNTGDFPPDSAAALGDFPLRSRIVGPEKILVPRRSRPRGGDFVLLRILPPEVEKR